MIHQQVKKEDLETILACGLNEPSGSNKQDTKIVVVQDEHKVKLLSELYKDERAKHFLNKFKR